MLEELVRFDAGSLPRGINDWGRDFQPDTELSDESTNISYGRWEGWHPRCGIEPVPCFSADAHPTLGVTYSPAPSYYSAAAAMNGGFLRAIVGHCQFSGRLPSDDGLYPDSKTFHCYFVKITSTTCGFFIPSSGMAIYATPKVGGFLDVTYAQNSFTQYLKLNSTIRNFAAPSATFDGVKYARMAVLNIRGGDIKANSIVCQNTNVAGTEKNAAKYGVMTRFGVPVKNTLARLIRDVRVVATGAEYTLGKIDIYSAGTDACYRTSRPDIGTISADVRAQLNTLTSTSGSGDGSYSVFHDAELKIERRYSFLAAAFSRNAYGAIVFENILYGANSIAQVDFSEWKIPDVRTRCYVDSDIPPVTYRLNLYAENGIQKTTAWVYWAFNIYGSYSGTSVVTEEAIEYTTPDLTDWGVARAANQGILRWGVTYEVTYSFYNKVLDTETNVGTPARFQWGFGTVDTAQDFYALVICGIGTGTKSGISDSAFCPFQRPPAANYNHYDIRVYYRQYGSTEWLFGGSVSCVDMFWDPTFVDKKFCTGTEVGTVGGQPGGFNDYSPLPQDSWMDTLVFQDRLFWFSQNQFVFSMRNKVVAYPGRNSVPFPSGKCRGGVVHTFPGQATQEGRLVVFGTDEMYVCRFRGVGFGIPQTVQVSATSIAEFELEGSDFDIQRRSSYTAFSSRAAVVADGTLFFWGPQGVFADGGVNLPERISKDIDIYLTSLADYSKADDFHCSYDPMMREIRWYYPRASGTGTGVLNLNQRTGEFSGGSIGARVDWSDSVVVERDDVAPACGKRVMLGIAEIDAERCLPYFSDSKVLAGDMLVRKELMVTKVEDSGDATLKTFTVDANAVMGSIVAGNRVVLSGASRYVPAGVTFPDIAGVVVSKPATYQIQVRFSQALAQNVDYSAAINGSYRFPLFTDPIHGIDWVLETQLWAPAGLKNWFLFLFAHTVWRVSLLPAAAGNVPTVTMSHRSPQSGAYVARVLALVDNCRGTCQIHSQLINENMAAEGQALQFRLSGKHNGDEWALQNLSVEAEPVAMGIDSLRMFEG